MQPSEVLGGQKGPCLTITTYARNQKCIACYDRIQHNAYSGSQLMHAIKSNAYFEQTQCILWVLGSQSHLMRAFKGVMFCLHCYACYDRTLHADGPWFAITTYALLQSNVQRLLAMHVMI